MDFMSHINVIVLGFAVWMLLAPQLSSTQWGERFLAYMTTLLLCLIGTSEIMLSKPEAFFFTVGGALAFIYIVIKIIMSIRIEH